MNPHPASNDDDLDQAAQAGDHDAFAALLDAPTPHIRTFLALRAPAAQLVDELAHDTTAIVDITFLYPATINGPTGFHRAPTVFPP